MAGRLERIRAAAFAEPKPEARPKGRSGTVNTGGFISEQEFNFALRWPRNLDTYDEMRRTDPTVRWMLSLPKTAIRAASWSVEPAGADDEAREHAAFCEHALFEQLEGGWDEFLRRVLTFLEFGHSVFEQVAELRDVEFTYEDAEGDEQTVTREAFVVAQLAERMQRTIQRWVPEPGDTSKLREVEQWLGDGESPANPVIPAERLVVFTNEQEGDDWRGVSILRTAYRNWEYKRRLENLEAIAYERSTGLPVVYPPSDAEDPQLDAVEEALKDLRQGESVYLIMPGPKAGTVKDEEGWLVDAVSIGADANHSADEPIKRHEAAMARNVLAEFMRLGHENVGARATGDVQQDPYYQAVEAYVRYIEDVVSERVLRPLVRWNYGDVPVPRLRASKITAKNVDVLGKVTAQLVSSRAITVDLETENALRDLLDLPRRKPDDEDEEPGETPTVPPSDAPEPTDPEAMQPDPEAEDQTFTFAEWTPWRALRPEEQCVNFAEIARKLDSAQEGFVRVAENAARPAIERARDAAEQAAREGSPERIASVEVDAMELMKAAERELQALHEEGRRQVRAEIARQKRENRTFENVPIQSARVFFAQAATAAASMAQAATRAIRTWALRKVEDPSIEPTGPGFEPFAALRAEARGVALGLTSQAFNAGRQAEIASQVDVVTTVYSAMLDTNTCGPCADADGVESEPGEEPTPAPNPDCEGGGACRCMLVPVVRSEPV